MLGNGGGALADLWERADHEVTRIGREGGDISDAEAVVVAVHGGAIRKALDNVQGIEGKTIIDAANLLGVSLSEGFSLKPRETLSFSLKPRETLNRWSVEMGNKPDGLYYSHSIAPPFPAVHFTEKPHIRTSQRGGRNPARVTMTSRRTAALDGRLLAAVRTWRQ